ncbi:hypothetical protein GW17_00003228 [Ensete ventricosum]|nr:hypothetical protein GW17_00003228 [Ensete ventricosum]
MSPPPSPSSSVNHCNPCPLPLLNRYHSRVLPCLLLSSRTLLHGRFPRQTLLLIFFPLPSSSSIATTITSSPSAIPLLLLHSLLPLFFLYWTPLLSYYSPASSSSLDLAARQTPLPSVGNRHCHPLLLLVVSVAASSAFSPAPTIIVAALVSHLAKLQRSHPSSFPPHLPMLPMQAAATMVASPHCCLTPPNHAITLCSSR